MPKAPLSRPIAAILKLKSYWYGNAALIPPPKFNGLVLPNFKHGFDSFEAVPSHTTSSISDPTSSLNTVDFQNGSGQIHFPERGILLLNSPCDYFLCSLFYPHEACIVKMTSCTFFIVSIRCVLPFVFSNICSVILYTHSFWE